MLVGPTEAAVWGAGCGDCAGLRESLAEARRSLSGALADAKVWRHLHGKAQQRAESWQGKSECQSAEPTARKLAEAERLVVQQRQRILDLEGRIEGLEQENAGLQQRNRDLLKKPFGTRSERRKGPREPGEGSRPGGARVAVRQRIEIEGSGYVRRIRRPRRRAAGTREWSDFGLRLAAGTLLGHGTALRTWFEPLEQAIARRQAQAQLVHGDETSWVIHVRGEAGQNPRCWLWICLSADAVRLRVEPSRSAVAAASLFGGIRRAVLVCDRYPAYAKLERTHPGQFERAYCWAHMRRDFLAVGRARPDLQGWTDGEGRKASWRKPDPRRGPLQSLLKHRTGLEVFVGKPYVPLDTNPAEEPAP